MALSDIEAKFTNPIPHKTCAVCFYMDELGDEWASRLRGLLSNRAIRFRDLAHELYDDPDEPDIPEKALSRHAQRGCAAQEKLR